MFQKVFGYLPPFSAGSTLHQEIPEYIPEISLVMLHEIKGQSVKNKCLIMIKEYQDIRSHCLNTSSST